MSQKPFEKLPRCVKPIRYKLCLTPYFKNFTFKGKLTIEVQVVKKTNVIKLNALGLNIQNITLRIKGTQIPPKDIELCNETETLTINFNSALDTGIYELEIRYSGILNDILRGFYRSKVTNENGIDRYCALTYFVPTDARRCFPCWDEPSFKAIFDVNVICDSALVALSNMPEKSAVSIEPGITLHKFESSPIMSTYLLCIIVGDYSYIEDSYHDVKIRVYAPKNKIEQGSFALEVAVKCLAFYGDYFQMSYLLPKLDLIAISDLDVGAMENWGLITYRESLLLVDSKNTSSVMKEHVALTVAHEIAHQWFGNLVTMEWWNDIWLNEGFATFMQYLTIGNLYPEFDVWSSFMSLTYQLALELDSLANSHPIEVEVGHPSEINEIFDTISYRKGCSVIRMLYKYLGDFNFRKGMHNYFSKHKFKNTTTKDLWAALETASEKPIKKLMNSWIKQVGYPIISVTGETERTGFILNLKQEQFLLNGSKVNKEDQTEERQLWCVPISVVTSNSKGKVAELLFDKPTFELYIPNFASENWIKVNPESSCFFRTQYSPELLEKFIPAIKNKSLPTFDRLSLISDLFQISQAGYVSTGEVLKFLCHYQDETDPSIWTTILNNVTRLEIILAGTTCEQNFRRYKKRLLSNIYEDLGWEIKEDEHHSVTKLRPLIYIHMVRIEDQSVLALTKEKFDKHIGSGPNIPADMRPPVFKGVVQAGHPEVPEILFDRYKKTDSSEEKYDIASGLASSKDPALLKTFLDFAMSNNVREQDKRILITYVIRSGKTGATMTWNYLTSHCESFKKAFDGTFTIQNIITAFKDAFTTLSEAEELEQFFKKNPFIGTEKCIKQAVETIRNSANWCKRDYNSIEDFLINF